MKLISTTRRRRGGKVSNLIGSPPIQTGTTSQQSATAAGTSSTSSTGAAPLQSGSQNQSAVSNLIGSPPMQTGSSDHRTRDTLAATGAAGAGVAGYEAHKHHGEQAGTQGQSSVSNLIGSPPMQTGSSSTAPSQLSSNTSANTTRGQSSVSDMIGTSPMQSGSRSGIQQGSTQSSSLPSQTQTEPQHHYGRDAALATGATGAGVAAYEAHKHHGENEAARSQPATSDLIGAPPMQAGSSSVSRNQPTSTSTHAAMQSSTLPTQTQAEPQHHYGRDAAVATGASGAGLAAYEAEKRHRENEAARTQPTYSAAPTTTAPAATQSTSRTTQAQAEPQHHYGRDATLATGAGAAAYEAEKHHSEKEAARTQPTSNIGTTSSSSQGSSATEPTQGLERVSTGPAPRTIGPHDKDWKNVLDPRVRPEPALMRQDMPEQQTTSHKGRDTAAIAGVGAAGAAAYEADKHHKAKETVEEEDSEKKKGGLVGLLHRNKDHDNEVSPETRLQAKREQDAALASAGLVSNPEKHHRAKETVEEEDGEKKKGGLLGLLHRKKDNEDEPTSHKGRDATAVAGVGAAAYEADKHHKAREAEAVRPQQVQRVEDTHTTRHHDDEGKKGGLLGALHRNKDNETEPRSHDGRDATAVAGVGAAGLTAYEADKHHKQREAERAQAQPSVQGTHITHHQDDEVKKGGLLGTLHRNKDQEDHPKSHDGRDATAAAGVGAAGLTAYEADKHHKQREAERAQQQPITRAEETHATHHHEDEGKKGGLLGFLHRDKDKHEAEKAEKAEEKSQHHYGRDATAAGALGAGAYEADKHHKEREQAAAYPASQSGTAGALNQQSQQSQHHYGRDATAAGGVAALGAGAYEAEKHHKEREQAAAYPASQSGTAGALNQQSQQSQHHYGRDATAAEALQPLELVRTKLKSITKSTSGRQRILLRSLALLVLSISPPAPILAY